MRKVFAAGLATTAALGLSVYSVKANQEPQSSVDAHARAVLIGNQAIVATMRHQLDKGTQVGCARNDEGVSTLTLTREIGKTWTEGTVSSEDPDFCDHLDTSARPDNAAITFVSLEERVSPDSDGNTTLQARTDLRNVGPTRWLGADEWTEISGKDFGPGIASVPYDDWSKLYTS